MREDRFVVPASGTPSERQRMEDPEDVAVTLRLEEMSPRNPDRRSSSARDTTKQPKAIASRGLSFPSSIVSPWPFAPGIS